MMLTRMRRRSHTFGLLLIAVAVIAAACGGGDDDESVTDGGAAAQTQPAEAEAEVADSQTETESVEASSFTITRVDGGTKPDIAIDAEGQPLIAYMLERMGAEGWVKVVNADGSNSEQIHTGYVYGPLDIESSADGRVVVGYHDHDNEDGSIATREGGAWSVTTIAHDGHDGWDSSIAFGQNGEIYYLGVDPSQFGSADGVELATLSGGTFTVRGLGSGPQPYEWGVDVAVGPDGELAAVFFDAVNQDLVFAVEDGDGFALARSTATATRAVSRCLSWMMVGWHTSRSSRPRR